MTIGYHCDCCGTWSRNPEHMLKLTGQGPGVNHFCSLDCCMRWCAAKSEPTQEVSL